MRYKVPFLDLKKEYQQTRPAIDCAVQHVLEDMQLSDGQNVKSLEDEFAQYCGTRFAVGVGSGTEALLLALLASGIRTGDEVITVSHTFIATVAVISFVGATPVFVDIDPRTYTMDPAQVTSRITERTKAIIPVHMYGHMADMDPILAVAKARGLVVIEDACQAHGAEYTGKKSGSLGDCGCFSFVYTKLLNAYGDAGIVVTNDLHLAERIRLLRDHGRSSKGVHTVLGLNCRLDEIHAAIVRLKLRSIEDKIAMRRTIANMYGQGLLGLDLRTPYEHAGSKHSYWQYVIRTSRRNELSRWLDSTGIGYGIYYPIPCHLQPACRHLGYTAGSLPATEHCSSEVLSLPIYSELEPTEVQQVIESLRNFFADEGA
jgi:dTDP-4-amino-4,6-dideoxygalactose transaminase